MRPSSRTSTLEATPAHIAQSYAFNPVVRKIAWAGGQNTATPCSTTTPASDHQSSGLVKKMPVEGRDPLDARVEHVEELEEHEGGEGERQGLCPGPRLQSQAMDAERACHHEEAERDDVDQARQGKKRLGSLARRFVHDHRNPEDLDGIKASGRPIKGEKKSVKIAPIVVDS